MPDTVDMLRPSGDHKAMSPYWAAVAAILGGVSAMRAGGKTYLPQFPNESSTNYQHRLANSKFTNIFEDIVENLASRPFTQEVGLANDAVPPAIDAVVEDVDRAGNHLHVFAQDVFFNGIANAIDWILVDHTRAREGMTLADERRMGARPFWVRIPAKDMLAVYSAMVDGREQFIYARINETYTRQAETGIEEETIERVRVLVRDPTYETNEAGQRISADPVGYGPARFEIWEKSSAKSGGWNKVDEDRISIGVIPLVPFIAGRRKLGTWQVSKPLQKVVDLQIEHYQQETNLKAAKELTAFPMFKGDGISPPLGPDGQTMEVPLGPSTVLYAPFNEQGTAHGTWGILEISASSLKFLAEEVRETERQMRELGRVPMTAGTAGITQIAAALQSQKASSAIQAWAFLLKDALERAFSYTAMWLGVSIEPTVYVDTDFAIELGAEKAPDVLLTMHERNVISTATLRDEMKRRAILSPEFDNKEEDDRLEQEMPEDDDGEVIAAATPPLPEDPELSA